VSSSAAIAGKIDSVIARAVKSKTRDFMTGTIMFFVAASDKRFL
jgi:hypothetical protein